MDYPGFTDKEIASAGGHIAAMQSHGWHKDAEVLRAALAALEEKRAAPVVPAPGVQGGEWLKTLEALAEKMMRDSWATGDDAAWKPGMAALLAHAAQPPQQSAQPIVFSEGEKEVFAKARLFNPEELEVHLKRPNAIPASEEWKRGYNFAARVAKLISAAQQKDNDAGTQILTNKHIHIFGDSLSRAPADPPPNKEITKVWGRVSNGVSDDIALPRPIKLGEFVIQRLVSDKSGNKYVLIEISANGGTK